MTPAELMSKFRYLDLYGSLTEVLQLLMSFTKSATIFRFVSWFMSSAEVRQTLHLSCITNFFDRFCMFSKFSKNKRPGRVLLPLS